MPIGSSPQCFLTQAKSSCAHSVLERIMTPVLQAFIAVAVGVLFGLLLLCQMPLVVCSYTAHMRKVIFIILGRILFRILLEDFDDLPATSPQIRRGAEQCYGHSPFVTDALPRTVTFGPPGIFRAGTFQPLLKFVSRHIDGVVEIPIAISLKQHRLEGELI